MKLPPHFKHRIDSETDMDRSWPLSGQNTRSFWEYNLGRKPRCPLTSKAQGELTALERGLHALLSVDDPAMLSEGVCSEG